MLAAASASTVPIHSCAACSVKYARSAPITIARLDSRLSANAANLLYPECRRMTKSPISCGISAAIIAHEIPQEIGDFVILLHSGYSKFAALALNLLSSLAMVIGALLAYFTLQAAQEWIGTVLALAAASMIYVAVADLIPGLHRRPELHATAQQVGLIALGVALIWVV